MKKVHAPPGRSQQGRQRKNKSNFGQGKGITGFLGSTIFFGAGMIAGGGGGSC